MNENCALSNANPAKAKRRGRRTAEAQRIDQVVRPGMESQRFTPLSEAEVKRVHTAALDVLESVGMEQATPKIVELVTAKGGRLTEEGRLLFPRALVEEQIAATNRTFLLHGQDPKHDMDPHGDKVYTGTAGAAVHIIDPFTRKHRDSTLKDLYDVGRMVDKLDHIHFFQRVLVPRDLPDAYEMDINTCYAIVSSTTKHVGTSWLMPEHITAAMPMLHAIAGGEKAWRERPFLSMSNCFVVPPLRFAPDSCDCIEVAVREGMPVLLADAGMAGATGPTALAGALVQAVAESLAGLVFVNLLKPGHPVIFGIWSLLVDLRSGAMCSGSGEQAILAAACAQMGRFYDLATGNAAGMADAKLPDARAGFEKGYSVSMVAHSGANIVYEAAGMLGSLMSCCFESFVIDNEMLGNINRTIRGIEINEDSVSVEAIRRVCTGNGARHYLGDDQTMALMNTEYLYPEIGDRLSPQEWEKAGSPDIVQQARVRVDQLLSTHFPGHIPEEVDATIRASLPIRLPREAMQPEGTV